MSTREELSRAYAKRFTLHFPLNAEERNMDAAIIETISEHWRAGYDAGTARLRELESALRRVERETQCGPMLTDGAIVMVRAALEGSPSANSGAPDFTDTPSFAGIPIHSCPDAGLTWEVTTEDHCPRCGAALTPKPQGGCVMRKTPFAKKLDEVDKTAREWGYTTKRERATFVNGWCKGFADALSPEPLAKRKAKRPARGRV